MKDSLVSTKTLATLAVALVTSVVPPLINSYLGWNYSELRAVVLDVCGPLTFALYLVLRY